MSDPRKVGPYELRKRLGSGGMGVVWEAWDERLGRRVAVKQILPERGADPRFAEKLRREARAAARLSHPAIVQVFDLVQAEGGDWIVMEHVAGETLAERLRHGPLEAPQVLSLGQEVAEALAEAHDEGFLHRDLKTENVLLTPGGHAKVLDFGLAKAYRSREKGLTATGEIVGTYRAMSPEQVQGATLDPRSDLFSLGVLLYEVATGTSPFAGDSPGETLVRVCQHQQPPAAELAPGLPPELSHLVDELLAKDREHRPGSAEEVGRRLAALRSAGSGSGNASEVPLLDQPTVVEGPRPALSSSFRPAGRRRLRWTVATVLALVISLGMLAVLWRGGGPEPLRVVAVAAPQTGVGGGREEVALAAAAVRSALLRALVALSGVAPQSPEAETPGAADPESLARALAADEVVTSRLDCGAETCQLTLERRQVPGGRVSWVESLEIPLADFPLLATAVAAAVQRGYPEYELRRGVPELSVRPRDYARFLDVERAFRRRPEGADLERLLTELAAVRRGSPRFLEAYLLGARLWSFRHHDTRDPADLNAAFGLLEQARTLAPEDPRLPDVRFSVALPAGRLEEAEAALAELERLVPGDTRVLVRRALLAERRGGGEAALALMRTAARRRPSWRILLELANLEYRQGEIPAARVTLGELRERFPEDSEGLSLLAQIELLAGEPERAAELYGELVARSPRLGDLSNLGTAQLLLGRHDQAAASFHRALALAPANPAVLLNAADAELLLGREEEARRLYRRVVELVEADPAAGTLWQLETIRGQALAHLGSTRAAVAAVQQAQRLAPDNPQVAYEAALVYALVGDRASALVSAEQALAGGVEPRWFRFPWFEGLRRDSAFAALLSPG